MKLVHPSLQSPLCFSENEIQILILENKAFFSRFITELCEESEGETGSFVLSSDEEILDCAVCLDVVLDYFHLSPDRKRLHAKLISKMKAIAQQEFQLETMTLLQSLENYLLSIVNVLDYPLVLEQTGDVGALLKACAPKLRFTDASLAENLLDYMEAYRDLGGVRCFVLVNLKAYFTENELVQLCEAIRYRKLTVLLLESEQRKRVSSLEKICLLDEDFCELTIEKEKEM